MKLSRASLAAGVMFAALWAGVLPSGPYGLVREAQAQVGKLVERDLQFVQQHAACVCRLRSTIGGRKQLFEYRRLAERFRPLLAELFISALGRPCDGVMQIKSVGRQ